MRNRAAALVAEQVGLLATQSRNAVLGLLVGCSFVSAILARHVSWVLIGAWLALFIGANAYRMRLGARLLSDREPRDAAALSKFFYIALINGIWIGLLPVMFFGVLPDESRLALTVIVLLAAAGGAATYASFARGYLCFLLVGVPLVALGWGLHGGPRAWAVVLSLLMYAVVMARFSTYLASVFERSVLIRFEADAQREQAERMRVVAEEERGKAEEARHVAEEASVSKSRFLANASHDLRQPAQALALYTAVLTHNAETDEQRQIARSIAEASRVLGDLLDNLLDMSRLDAGAVQPRAQAVDIGQMLARQGTEARAMLAGRNVRVEVEGGTFVAQTDPVLLERALRNIVGNAVKFTTSGLIAIRAHIVGPVIRFEVEDTGQGIATEHQTLIFEEFFQVDNQERDRARGLGLGLSIVRRLIHMLGGEVKVESAAGKGSKFTLTIPALFTRAPDESDLRPRPSVPMPDLRGRRVLVIDDEQMVSNSLSALLQTWGADVDTADGLHAALALGPPGNWQLCLCDLRLRGGEDGISTAARLNRDAPDLPIVFITGDTAPARIEQATRTGRPLMHKPVDEVQLARQVRALL